MVADRSRSDGRRRATEYAGSQSTKSIQYVNRKRPFDENSCNHWSRIAVKILVRNARIFIRTQYLE